MKTLLLLICIIATLGLQVPAEKIKRQVMTTSVCAGKDGVMVGMPGSCSGFFFCIDGNAIASSCGSYYHFNSRLSICDHPDKALCNGKASIKEVSTDAEALDVCAQAPEGYIFGKLNSCTLFYVCRERDAVRRVCPPQKHFNGEVKLCQDEQLAQCIYATPLELVTMPATQATLPATTDAHTTASMREPMYSKKPVQADYSKISFSPATVCSGRIEKTTVAHPWDCGKFIYCLRDHPMLMQCPKGLHFSSHRQRCEWPTVAKCML